MSSLILLLCACAFVAGSAYIDEKPFYDVHDEELCLKLFDKFIDDHGKLYDSHDEKLNRYSIFKQNLHHINERNQKNPLAVFDISHHSDLTKEEFLALHTGLVHPGIKYDEMLNISTVNLPDVPDHFDWRDHNVVTPVKNQGYCGSCWAFSTTGVIEAQYAMKHHKLVSFSEQQLVSCDTKNKACNGGFMTEALSYVAQAGGIESEKDYPYVSLNAHVPDCKFEKEKVTAKVTETVSIDLRHAKEQTLQKFLVTTGPVAIALDGSGMIGYKKGILTECNFHGINHALLLVGYGSEKGVSYWIVKNSWGEQFGEKGYFRMSFGINCLNFLNELAASCTVE